MKTRILAAIAIAVALPTVAQANSLTAERHFDQQSEVLNIEQTAQYHALPTRYTVDTVDGGHSNAADQSLKNVAESTQLSTDVQSSHNALIGEGQSAAAGQALQNATQTVSNDKGSVEVNFASL